MPEFIPRSLVVLTVVVAGIALWIGIRDYVGAKNRVWPAVTTGTQKAPQPYVTVRKKAFAVNKRRMQASATETNAQVSNTGGNGAETPLIREILARGETAYNGAKTAKVQPLLNEANSRSSPHECVPLPNSTKPEDVDAIYYQGWAREYGCGLD